MSWKWKIFFSLIILTVPHSVRFKTVNFSYTHIWRRSFISAWTGERDKLMATFVNHETTHCGERERNNIMTCTKYTVSCNNQIKTQKGSLILYLPLTSSDNTYSRYFKHFFFQFLFLTWTGLIVVRLIPSRWMMYECYTAMCGPEPAHVWPSSAMKQHTDIPPQ